jgi:hypothetical protein
VQELQKLRILTTNNSLFFSILFFQTTRIPLVLRLGEMREDRERERERERELQRDLNLQPAALTKCSKMGVRFIRVN